MLKFISFISLFILSPNTYALPDYGNLRLNELQFLSTHNSYKQKIDEDIYKALLAWNQEFAKTLDYTHFSLRTELEDFGVRHFELDLYADPKGGHYKKRLGLELVGKDPNAYEPSMAEPGFKVLHIQDIDFMSSCLTLKECLSTIKSWSKNHPKHLPIAIQLEVKEDEIPDPDNLGFTKPYKITPKILDDLDREILSVFPLESLLTPDDVRADYKTLEQAVLNHAWPKIKNLLGKVYFLFDCTAKHRRMYLKSHPSLKNRVMFASSQAGRNEASFLVMNNPISNFKKIKERVASGYLVRTRADADTKDARTGDTTRQEFAWASGAHFVSTDYLSPDPRFKTDYFVKMPGGKIARCNPVFCHPK